MAKSCIIQIGNSLKGYQNEVRGYDKEKYVGLVNQEPGYFGYSDKITEKFDKKKASSAQKIILDRLKQCYKHDIETPKLRLRP